MKADLMDLLCCPVCRGDLALKATRTKGEEILEGTLTCTKCHETYPISDGIPDLLPPAERG
jgi:uncharacterized protein YbaR (Trm112 family)